MKTIIFLLLILSACCCVHAQTVTLPWWGIDAGGGKSSGSGFTLTSSLGQPVAGTMTGTGFVIEGGFIPGVRQLSGAASNLDIQLSAAWNLLSVPFISSDMRKTTLYPSATSNAFAYNPLGYVVRDTLQSGIGYWLKFPSPQTVAMTGTAFAPETVDVLIGWNLIGTVSYPALTSDIIALPAAAILSPYFGYTASGYYSEDTLKPGRGYWVKSAGTGKLVISAASTMAPVAAPAIAAGGKKQGSSIDDELKDFQSLRVKDARGEERTVWFSASTKDIGPGRFELPPIPPGDVLDVRFRSQRMAEMASGQGTTEFPLQISGAAFPLTLNWVGMHDGGNYAIVVRTEKGTREYPMTGTRSLVVPDENSFMKIRMARQEEELPKSFALYQNFPNPFNPATAIRYDVPKSSRVSLKIYDILGQDVFTLVDEERAAGKYTVEFNAGNFPSGVYYFRMLAGDFSDVKKLLLTK